MSSLDRVQCRRSALLLVRTPLQAWISGQVLQAEGVGRYDLAYFTHNDSSEDQHYFGELAAGADQAQYCHAPVRRYDILGHLDFHRQTASWKRRQAPDNRLEPPRAGIRARILMKHSLQIASALSPNHPAALHPAKAHAWGSSPCSDPATRPKMDITRDTCTGCNIHKIIAGHVMPDRGIQVEN